MLHKNAHHRFRFRDLAESAPPPVRFATGRFISAGGTFTNFRISLSKAKNPFGLFIGHFSCTGAILASFRTGKHTVESNLTAPATIGAFHHSHDSLQSHEARSIHFAQSPPRQTTAHNVAQDVDEPVSIVSLSIIESSRLLIDIALQVERGNAHPCSVDATLEQAPEVLKAVRVNQPSTYVSAWLTASWMIVGFKPFIRLASSV
jgi:hypothetical protein